MAELTQPSILWIEEINFIARGKDKDLFYGFLSELDKFNGPQSLIIATTYKLGDIDKALRRGGRLDIDIRMDMPSASDRFKILKTHLSAIGATL